MTDVGKPYRVCISDSEKNNVEGSLVCFLLPGCTGVIIWSGPSRENNVSVTDNITELH